jgi:hypothetical protein
LSTLAPELLHSIFSLAYERTKPKAPLSRSLRPFYDAVKFSKITAQGAERVRSLLETVSARPAFGNDVHELSLANRDRDTDLETGDMQALFGLLPNLRVVSIRVSNPSWIETVLPTRDGVQTALPESIKVLIATCSKPYGGGYGAKALAVLQRLPNLNSVLLDFARNPKDNVDPIITKPALTKIEVLGLGLHDDASTEGDFVACFPRLRRLNLWAHGSTCDFLPALISVKSYQKVCEICLSGCPPPGWRFPKELAKFSALQKLSLNGDFGRVGLEAYSALRSVPITTLQVNKGCDISAAALETLLGPRGSCPTLKILQLDNLLGAYPPDFGRHDFRSGQFNLRDYGDNSDDAEWFLAQFELPEWTTRFSHSAYEQLACTARLYRVDLRGSTVTAHEIEVDWQALEEEVEEMRWEEEEQDRYERGELGADDPADRLGGGWTIHFRSASAWRDNEEEVSE